MCYSFLIYFEMPSSFAVYLMFKCSRSLEKGWKKFERRAGCTAWTCTKIKDNVTYMNEIISEGTKTNETTWEYCFYIQNSVFSLSPANGD